MQDTIQRPKLNLKWMDAPIESDKWRNLCFDKYGNSYRGIKLFASESDAYKYMIETEKWLFSKSDTGRKRGLETQDGSILSENYSHCFQMPVKE